VLALAPFRRTAPRTESRVLTVPTVNALKIAPRRARKILEGIYDLFLGLLLPSSDRMRLIKLVANPLIDVRAHSGLLFKSNFSE